MICDISSPSKNETDGTNSGGKTSGEKQQNRGGRVGVGERGNKSAEEPLPSLSRSLRMLFQGLGGGTGSCLSAITEQRNASREKEEKEENTYVRHQM